LTPHLDAALREFEAAVGEWQNLEARDGGNLAMVGFPLNEWDALKAALDASDREECRAGSELEGFPGSLWRFLAQCDFRRVTPWFNGERLRGLPQACMFDVAAAAVASIVLQMVGTLVRSQMKEAAREILEHAVKFLDRDIEALKEHKKAGAVLRHNLWVVPGG
jgi:hypothetical protein